MAFLSKRKQISMQNFKPISANSFELSCDGKKRQRTYRRTHSHIHTDIFGKHQIFSDEPRNESYTWEMLI